MENKICVNCQKNIDEKKERYFEVIEYLEGKAIEKKYVHKTCQDKVKQQMNSNQELQAGAKNFLQRANQFMNKMSGEEEVVVI